MTTQQATLPKKYSRLTNIAARAGITLVALGLLFLLRQDLFAWTWDHTGNLARRARTPFIISAYLKNTTEHKLQLGAGGLNMPGWLNTDIEPADGEAFLDAGEHFPLPDASFRLVFSEQVLEHLSYEQGLVMMKESCRILEHGGKVRVATPNLLKLTDLLRDDKTPEQEAYVKGKMDWSGWKPTPDPADLILNSELTEYGHQLVYTPKMLRKTLEAAGFTQIQQYQSGESDDPALKGLERRSHLSSLPGGPAIRDIDHYETMVFEAVRP